VNDTIVYTRLALAPRRRAGDRSGKVSIDELKRSSLSLVRSCVARLFSAFRPCGYLFERLQPTRGSHVVPHFVRPREVGNCRASRGPGIVVVGRSLFQVSFNCVPSNHVPER